DAMIRHAEQELKSGNADAALKAANRAITVNPLREDAHRLIVQALVTTGRKAEALKHYQDLMALLKRELNTEPDAATKSLVGGLRSIQPPRGSPAASEIADPALPPASGQRLLAGTVRSGGIEQRQLTIMACNLVGSVPFSTGLDPEQMHDLVAAFHKSVA